MPALSESVFSNSGHQSSVGWTSGVSAALELHPRGSALQTLSGRKLQPAGYAALPWLIFVLFVLRHFSCAQLFCDPMECGPSGCSVHGILREIILEWVSIPSSRGSSQPRDRTRVSFISCIGRWALFHQGHLLPFELCDECLEVGSEGKAEAAFEWEIFPVALDGALSYQKRERTLLWLREANKRQS